jgi:DNA-binding FrmR family transcriptional regulator
VAPVAPATESEALWQLCRRLEGHVHGLEERLGRVERRDDLGDLREQIRALAIEVGSLEERLLDMLQGDRESLVDALTHTRPRTPLVPRPGTSLGPPQAVRAHLRAWVGWSLVGMAGATATALTAAILALARGCG